MPPNGEYEATTEPAKDDRIQPILEPIWEIAGG
jgi:hypothetical protein